MGLSREAAEGYNGTQISQIACWLNNRRQRVGPRVTVLCLLVRLPLLFLSGRRLSYPKQLAFLQNIPQVEGRGVFRKLFKDFKAEGVFAVSVPLRLQLFVAMKALAQLEELAVLRGVEVW